MYFVIPRNLCVVKEKKKEKERNPVPRFVMVLRYYNTVAIALEGLTMYEPCFFFLLS